MESKVYRIAVDVCECGFNEEWFHVLLSPKELVVIGLTYFPITDIINIEIK